MSMKQKVTSLEELQEKIHQDLKKQLKPLDEKLDWIIGEYKKFDEEQTLISAKVTKHENDIEYIQNALGIQAT